MKKQIKNSLLVLLKQQTCVRLNQVDISIDTPNNDAIKIWSRDHNTFNNTELIPIIEGLSSVNCFLCYDNDIQKVVLHIF